MIRRPPRSTPIKSSAASDVYKRQGINAEYGEFSRESSMAHTTGEKLSEIAEDLKTSWYYRVWAFVWLTLALSVFAILIILGQASTHARGDPTFQFWVENTTSLAFPKYFVYGLNKSISDTDCRFKGQPIMATPCQHAPNCWNFDGSSVTAQHIYGDIESRTIRCTFTTDVTTPTNISQMIGFGLEARTVGPNNFLGIYIAPNNNSWIYLSPDVIQRSGEGVENDWERRLVYHSTFSVPRTYMVSISIERFLLLHADQTDKYSGWMAVGEIGGYAFFAVLLHKLVMILVGFVLENNSKSLST
eukprot:TRINITY_DN1136_c0_g1_i1.p1 TRINITY_DN1136_c0_g1~~TRINITY_DN1136_c0_g1_i1.p1  ORF type:complete len:302 (-),score=64.16 TRINITY_DN1136_c0_g1_i1:80-985(-)